MTMTQTPAVYAAISGVMAEMGKDGIAKGRKNAQQGYSFRGVDDVQNALNGPLVKHGLLFLPRVLSRTQEERLNKSGGAIFYTTVDMEFDFVAISDGSMHTIRMVGEAMDSADKSSNKAMSAAYKYAALQTFCIPTEGDNDADSATHEPAPRAPAAQEAPSKGEADEAATALAWTEKFIVGARSKKDTAELSELQHSKKDALANLRAKHPEYAARCDAVVREQLEKLDPLDDSIPF